MLKKLIIIFFVLLSACSSSEGDMKKGINQKEVSIQEKENARLQEKARVQEVAKQYQQEQNEIIERVKKDREIEREKIKTGEIILSNEALKYEQGCLQRGGTETTCQAVAVLYDKGYR
jgi:hypothetical protein